MQILIEEHLRLELIHEQHAKPIFELVDKNRKYLRTWLTFVDHMKNIAFAEKFVAGTMQRNRAGQEYAFVIMEHEQVIGRIGIYKIDHESKIGEIGYWIAEAAQGKGIVTRACKAMMPFCFGDLQLNKLEIKCGTHNLKSQHIAERLHFTKEGIIRAGEWNNGQYIDLNAYGLLKAEYDQLDMH